MVVLSLILAHLIADFWLQTDLMVKDKLKNLTKHSFHHLLTTAIALAFIWVGGFESHIPIDHFILPLSIIVISHIFIDLLKIKLIDSMKATKTNHLRTLGYFLLDQLLHIIIILITCTICFGIDTYDMTTIFIETKNFSPLYVFLFLMIIFILATSVSGHIVKHIVGSLPSELANYEGELILRSEMVDVKERVQPTFENKFSEEYRYFTYSSPPRSRGKLIGYIERLLVIILTVIGAYPSIAFIIAAKSIARFKQLDDRNWAEYFLLGTLSSIFLGLVLGLIVQWVLM